MALLNSSLLVICPNDTRVFVTVVPIFVYIIVAHLLVYFVPGAVPLKLKSIIGYACIFVIVFGVANILKIIFVYKKNKILKEKLLNEAEKTNNKKSEKENVISRENRYRSMTIKPFFNRTAMDTVAICPPVERRSRGREASLMAKNTTR